MYSFSAKFFQRCRVLGVYGLVLQQLVEDGHLAICDSIVDENNMPVPGVSRSLLFSARRRH